MEAGGIAMNSANSISFTVNECRRRFDSIIESFPHAAQQCEVDIVRLKDGYGRFKLWAGSLGAHKIGPKSLDTRLAESPRVLEAVLFIVQSLKSALEQCKFTKIRYLP